MSCDEERLDRLHFYMLKEGESDIYLVYCNIRMILDWVCRLNELDKTNRWTYDRRDPVLPSTIEDLIQHVKENNIIFGV